MRKNKMWTFALAAVLAGMVAFSAPAHAQNAETIYKGKCAGCHGADGTGSAIGKRLGARDFHSADVQKQSDAELSSVIEKGKNKMPGYEKSLKPDQIKELVAYIRTMK